VLARSATESGSSGGALARAVERDLETAARQFEAAEKARDAAVATLERAAARGGSPGGKR